MTRGPALKVEAVPLSRLRPNPENPRRISEHRLDQLIKALEEDPDMMQARPVIALPDGTVIAGNMRYLAAQRLGWSTIPTVFVDLPPERAKVWMLRDNAAYGEWDEDALAELLHDLAEDGVDLELTGFADDEITKLLNSVATPLEAADDVPPLPAEPKTKAGDLYVLGQHRVMCGDARDRSLVSRLMGDAKASLLLTDPPYGIGYEGKTSARLRLSNDDEDGAAELLADAFAAVDPAMRTGAAIYLFHPAGRNALTFLSALADRWSLRQMLVWHKDSMVLSHADYHYEHELIAYANKPTEGRWGRGAAGWYGGNAETSVFDVPRPKASREHPTAKPVALMSRLVNNSSAFGDVVLDPFLGSGSTMIACEETGRRCFGLEIDRRYVDVAVRRWEACTGQEATLEGAAIPHVRPTFAEEPPSRDSRGKRPSGLGSPHVGVDRADTGGTPR